MWALFNLQFANKPAQIQSISNLGRLPKILAAIQPARDLRPPARDLPLPQSAPDPTGATSS
jgi:hypothetical protein